MQISGRVQNGVVILEGGPPLPEGAQVTVSFNALSSMEERMKERVSFPLLHSKHPGSVRPMADYE